MIRLWIASIGLWVCLAALCIAVVLWGRVQPQEPVLDKYGVTRCDAKLCFEGLEPGVSSWTAAMAKYANSSELMFMNSVGISLLHDAKNQVAVDLRSSANNKVIAGELNFRKPDSAPTIGKIILEFGSPCQVSVSSSLNDDTLDLIYPSSIIQFALPRFGPGPKGVPPMSVNTPIYALSLQDSTPRNCDALLAVYPVAPWLGFASDARYIAAAAQ